MEKTFQYRIYPNPRQRETIQKTFGCCRWVWNRALEMREAAYHNGDKVPGIYEIMRLLPAWKKVEAPWLAEADSMALQQSLRDLDRAYQNFFREPGKVGFPRYKSKRGHRRTYRTNTFMVVDARHVKLPKLGLVKARVSRPVEGRILSATVKQVPSGNYYVCVCCTDVPKPVAGAATVDMLGIDAGIHDVATCSTGERLGNQKALHQAERRLAREQRRLSRKQKGSRNYERQRAKVARCHEKVANRRKDALHKFTTHAVRESQAIAVEDLNVKGMARNRHLAKAVSDASMAELVRQLEYKCDWHGRVFVKVGRFYPSSKTCSCCGYVNRGLTLAQRSWVCPDCLTIHDRDLNAAVNIAREGMRILIEGTAGHAGTGALSANASGEGVSPEAAYAA